MAEVHFNPSSADDYRTFLKVKSLPSYRVVGRSMTFPDEYAALLSGKRHKAKAAGYKPLSGLFDYQRDIARVSIAKQKYAAFARCGLGKTLIFLEFARYVASVLAGEKCVLIVSPHMVIDQTMDEARHFYGNRLPIERVSAARLDAWNINPTCAIGITNYEALKPSVRQGKIGCLIPDESSTMKSHYGKWGQELLRLGAGLDWKLCLTGTPAPNDRIEYANHAVFLDAYPTVNSFLARFFVNRGQTNERWELKPHALAPFYRALSHWCIFLTNPATYGWKDNVQTIPPIHVHIHDVDLTADQSRQVREHTGELFVSGAGGIGSRAKLARISKTGDTLKPAYIRTLCESWPEESTLIWCKYNDEQDRLKKEMPDAASITGATPYEERQLIIADFKSGKVKKLVSKPKILGFGLNLQIATRQVFSTCQDSYEEFTQAIARSNRVGSTLPLNVHLPVTEAERPMIETVLRKAHRVDMDTLEQEKLFKEESGYGL